MCSHLFYDLDSCSRLWILSFLKVVLFFLLERIIRHGPVFTQEPSDSVFPLSTEDNKIFINCKAKGSPAPHYKWKFNRKDLDIDMDYSLVEGNLLINNPQATKHGGVYQCIATNAFGTILSREAKFSNFLFHNASSYTLSRACNMLTIYLSWQKNYCHLTIFSSEIRYSWIFNGRPSIVVGDNRRFVSQRTGNLYIAKVEMSDVGNYTCVVRNVMTNTTVYKKSIILTHRIMLSLHISSLHSVILIWSLFLTFLSPVPSISWKRADGSPFPGKMKINHSNGVLEIPYFRPEDSGLYECVAENSKGRSIAKGRLVFQSKWSQTLYDANMAIESDLHWECKANGKPQPVYRWLKNGQPLVSQDRICVDGGGLTISNINLMDSGMYQCLAENDNGVIYASAELKVVASPPDFSKNPVKKTTLIQRGGEAIIECRPHASPRASYSWRRGNEFLKDSKRRTISEDGTLRIANVTKSDAGRYTCVAKNPFGTSSSSGTLVVKEPTKITVPPLSMDATVGESIVLPCEVSKDSTLHPVFKWFFNGKLIDFSRHDHFGMIGGGSSGDLMIRNVQLKHSGKYVCMVHTAVDSVSAAADLIVRGPPGAPVGVLVGDITDRIAQLSWGPGPDNHSPVTLYIVQARTPFSIGWQAVKTVPDSVPGQMIHATAVNLNPWVDYEFRVVAINNVGVGEPSVSSKPVRTKAAGPEVAPANVSGGGGSRGELVIVWESVPEELQNGEKFGYVVAFRPLGTTTWKQSVLASADASRYIYKNDTFLPLTQFKVKVGVYNEIGEGPFSPVVIVYSADEEPSVAPPRVWARSLSASEIEVFWEPAHQSGSKGRITGYEVFKHQKWRQGKKIDAERVRVTESSVKITGLKGSTLYLMSVRAHNSAGTGPSSAPISITTKKPPPSQPPGNIEWNLTNSKVFLNWEHVKAMDNESEVTGYKVVYRQSWHRGSSVVETNRTSVELQLPSEEDLLVQIKALSDGGDGSSSSPIRIPKMSSKASCELIKSSAH
uniref:Contactin-4-like n=1 Tax=Sinocyclocheilus rhinocerous TaxID=307959 RepID=A0A673LUY0_9TELE